MEDWDRMPTRHLLRADRKGYGYKDLLEVGPGILRLLVTDKSRRRTWWLCLGVLVVAYLGGFGLVLNFLWPSAQDALISALGAVWGTAVFTGLFWSGFLVIVTFGDYYLPAYLARRPTAVVPMELISTTSFGFFQELEVRIGGQVQRITVNGTRRSVARAFRRAGMTFADTSG